jgi:hypothetical protein
MESTNRQQMDIIKGSYLAWVTMQFRTAEAAMMNLRQAIDWAREWGASWTDLGNAMGMSRQAAHKRFGGGPTPAGAGVARVGVEHERAHHHQRA